MGRNVPTYRQRLEQELARWARFRAALLRSEREDFDSLASQAFRYVHACVMYPEREAFDLMLVSLLLAHESRLRRLERALEGLTGENGGQG
ncbi:MAG: hypothetical protein QXO17_02305 [Nitrososphaerota archaeon]|nr:hypothetical protein [Candidatus Calditenuis fumarioli]